MGVGVSWPWRFGPTGGVVWDGGASRKRRLLAHAIMTAVYSRIDDPLVGIMGTKYVFRSGAPKALQNVFRLLTSEAITKYISQIRLDNLKFSMFTAKDGSQRWLIDVLYTDLETYQQDSVGVELPTLLGR